MLVKRDAECYARRCAQLLNDSTQDPHKSTNLVWRRVTGVAKVARQL